MRDMDIKIVDELNNMIPEPEPEPEPDPEPEPEPTPNTREIVQEIPVEVTKKRRTK